MKLLPTVFAVIAVSSACPGISPAFPSPSQMASDPVPVVELLKRLARDADAEANPFLNDRRVEMYRRQVHAEKDPVARMIPRVYLAFELFRSGRTDAAIKEIGEIQRTARRWKAPEDAPVMKSLRELLALSYLRLGEQQNCIARHSPSSCLMPIRDDGIHTIERGSRMAIQELTQLLKRDRRNLGYRWLLNLAYMTLGEYPQKVSSRWLIPPTAFASDYDLPRFWDIAPHLGVDMNGLAGGCIVEDFNGDGYLDIMASSWGLTDQLRYFQNQKDGSFSEATDSAGLTGQIGGLNILQGDYNNDGYPDVLILRGGWLDFMGTHQGDHPNSLLRNNGDGTFTDVTRETGLFSLDPTQTAAWADYNLDGWLDLFIGNESTGNSVHRCQMFRNDGDGTFTDVAAQSGLDLAGFVKGVAWGDFDNDGDPDLYISRFEQTNLLYRNNGPGGDGWSFTDVTTKARVAEPKLSFPTWFWDFDNDGWEDIFVASFSSYSGDTLGTIVADYLKRSKAEYSRLYRNNGDGTFTDVTKRTRFDAVLMAMGANFGDLDNDGFLDCYFGTGQPKISTLIPNRMFRNSQGRIFQDVTTSGGFGHIQKGHGISFADIDNDGDQDIYAVMGGAYSGDTFPNALFENPGNSNHWITLRLEGAESNRVAIGARIKVTARTPSGIRNIYRTISSGGSFGASSLQQEIGLGRAVAIDSIEITWPNKAGKTQRITDVVPDQILKIRENGESSKIELKKLELGPRRGRVPRSPD